MQIFLGITTKRRNSLYTPSMTESFECLLKEPTSVVTPVIQIRGDGVTNFGIYNYAMIPKFQRRYFITNIVSVNAHMWEISLEVDVLGTYREQILETPAFIRYAQSKFDTMIPDSRFPITDRCTNIYYEQPFPIYDATGNYVINIASKDANGDVGMAQSFVTDSAGIKAIASQLFQKDKLEELLQYYNNPLDMVISAIWLPVGSLFLGSGFGTATLGDSDIAFSGLLARKEYGSSFNITIELPHKAELPDGSFTYQDYRNVEPYTQYSITLPGVGVVDIPMSSWIQLGVDLPVVRVNYALSPLTGDITYELCCSESVIMMCHGNISVPVPLCNTAYNTLGAIPSYLSGIAGAGAAVTSFFLGNPIGAAAGIATGVVGMASTLNKSVQANNGVSGKLGGFDGERFCEKIKINVRPYDTTDTPAGAKETIGGSHFQHGIIGSYSGFINCTGAYVKCAATATEHELLNQLLNNFATNAYGGIIVE